MRGCTSAENCDDLDERVQRLLQELDEDDRMTAENLNSKTPRAEARTSESQSSNQFREDSKILRELERLKQEVKISNERAGDAKVALGVEEQRLRVLRSRPRTDSQSNRLLLRQEEEVRRAWTNLGAAQCARDAAELAFSRLHAVSGGVQQRAAQERRDATESASQRQTEERLRGELQVRKALCAQQTNLAMKSKENAEISEQHKKTQMHQAFAKTRLRSTQQRHKEQMEVMVRMQEEETMHHAQKVLELKSSIEAVGSEIRGQNEATRKKRESLDRERERFKLDLLSKGKNPYEVFRLQDKASDTRSAQCHAAVARSLHEGKVLNRIVHEK